MILRAISPLFAMRIFLNRLGHRLERYVPVLAWRPGFPLCTHRFQVSYENRSRLAWLDNIIQVTSFSSDVGVCKFFPVLLHKLHPCSFWILRLCNLVSEDDVDGAFRTHYRYLRGRPSQVGVCPYVLAA